MSGGADVVDGNGNLAVGFFPQRPTVLALHADGMRALLGEAGVVDDKDAFRVGECLGHAGTITTQDRLLVPGALIDELLQGLFGVLTRQALRQGDATGEGFNALAFAVEQKSLQINTRPPSRFGLWKIIGEERRVIAKALKHSRIQFWCVSLHTK